MHGLFGPDGPAVSKNAPIPMLPSSSWRRDSFFMRVAMATTPFSAGPAAFKYYP
jgi:hypothetical protein